MRISLFIILLVLSVLLQTTVLPYLHLPSFKPNFPLICTLYYGLYAGFFQGYLFGFFAGLFVDALSGGIFGLSAFIFTILGAFAGNLKRWVIIYDIKTQISTFYFR